MKNSQKFLIAAVLILTSYFLILIFRYWYADTLYTKGTEASLIRAINLSPNEPSFRLKLSESYTKLNRPESAISEMQKTIILSPSNVNLKRAEFSMYLRLSLADPKYLARAIETLEEAIQMAPTDAKLFYNLGLTLVRVGQNEKAIKILQKTIEMKPNYKEARLALAFFLIDEKKYSAARDELNYILTAIDSNDETTKKLLDDIISQ